MLLHSVVINNYCSFGSNDNLLYINPQVTTIIGVNESGKSNLINALAALDLVNGIPASKLTKCRNRITQKPISFSIRLKPLESDPVTIVGDGFTDIVLLDNGQYSLSGSAADCYEKKVEELDLRSAIKEIKISDSSARERVLLDINTIYNYREIPLAKTLSALKSTNNHIQKYFSESLTRETALDYISSLTEHIKGLISVIPYMFSHNNDKCLKNSYSLAELKTKDNNNKESIDHNKNDLLLHILKITEINRDDVISAVANTNSADRKTFERRANRAIEEKVLVGFREFYRKKDVKIELTFRIENNHLDIHVSSGDAISPFSERSNGLKWYLQMYIDLLANSISNRPIIYLLDEPGIFLHINAQDELRTMFFEHAKNGAQIVYSTHSPYMIDPNFACLRSISKTENEEFSLIHNSLYSTKSSSQKNLDTLSPIAAAIGMDMKLNPGISPTKLNIVVEGITDQIYINTMARTLGVDVDSFRVIPSTGADNSAHICSILYGWGLRFVALFDFDDKGKKCANDLMSKLNLSLEQGVLMLKEISADDLKRTHRIDVPDRIVIETLLSEEDRAFLSISPGDGDEKKKEAAVKFAAAVANGVKVSDKTCQSFRELFDRLLNMH